MLTPDQYREEAYDYLWDNHKALCQDLIYVLDGGELRETAHLWRLTQMCQLFAGIANARLVAENLVKVEAVSAIADSPET